MIQNKESRLAHNKALELLWSGSYEKALEILARLGDTPEVLNDRAVALDQLGRTEDAIALLKVALEKAPDYMPAFLNHRYMNLALGAANEPPTHKVLEDWGPPQGPVPAVSVIIPTYDRPEFLEESSKSVLDQTFKDFELIIVSDGGSPETGEVLKKLGSDKVRYMKIEHGGISAALNTGVAHARGRYVAYLDDDDIYYPDHLETLAAYLDSHPEADMAYTFSLRRTQRPEENGWATIDEEVFLPIPFDKERLWQGNIIQTTGSIMHRREIVKDIGGFNEKVQGCQDWEWYIRVSKRHEIRFIDKVTVEHRFRKRAETQLTALPKVMRHSNNLVRFINRQLKITSAVPGKMGYKRLMKKLAVLKAQWPELPDLLDLSELVNRKPYGCLYRMGRDYSRVRDYSKSRKAFFAAFMLAPWETKLWSKMIWPGNP